jgi:pyridoxal phosphate enzyme (YggS family)
VIEENLRLIKRNIAQAAERSGRKPEAITLVCVTKEANLSQAKDAIACGITDIGENRIQDAVAKYNSLADTVKWHLVGHLQSNKVKKAVEIFDLIHSVDSFLLAETISKAAAKINKRQDVLVQVNVSGEASKFGVESNKALVLIEQITALKNINVLGLMTIAPLVDDPGKTRACFRSLRMLRDRITKSPNHLISQLSILSMGMSNDYQVAIEEGATMVRIGSAIFTPHQNYDRVCRNS